MLQYLPQQLSADEIKVIVQQGIDEISAKTMQDMGKLMGLLKPQLEGKADMSIVSASVKELLNQSKFNACKPTAYSPCLYIAQLAQLPLNLGLELDLQ